MATTQPRSSAERSAPTLAVASAGARFVYALHQWVTPPSGRPSFVHVGQIGEVLGDVQAVAREVNDRRMYALKVASDIAVPAGTFAPMRCHTMDLVAPTMFALALERLHALFGRSILSLPFDLRLIEGLVAFDGSTLTPYVALCLLVAVGYGPVAERPPARTAAPVGGWVNGRLATDQLTFGGKNPYRDDYDRRMFPQLRPGTLPTIPRSTTK